MDLKTEIPVRPTGGSKGRFRRLTVVLTILGLATGFLVGFLLRPHPQAVGLLDAYPQRKAAEKRAIALVIGEMRDDGISFGEFAKLRRKRECPALNPKGFEFVASPSGAFPPRMVYVWDVYLGFNSDKYLRPCNVVAHLAAVYSDTGHVFPVDSEPGEINVNLGSSGPSPSAPSKASWLIDFRSGKAP